MNLLSHPLRTTIDVKPDVEEAKNTILSRRTESLGMLDLMGCLHTELTISLENSLLQESTYSSTDIPTQCLPRDEQSTIRLYNLVEHIEQGITHKPIIENHVPREILMMESFILHYRLFSMFNTELATLLVLELLLRYNLAVFDLDFGLDLKNRQYRRALAEFTNGEDLKLINFWHYRYQSVHRKVIVY